MNNKTQDFKKLLVNNLKKYAVTYLFLAISVFFIIVSGLDMNYICSQLLLRLNRNAFIVLALIIPIIAGMGINFAITIGAMAAQIGLLLTINWRITGVLGHPYGCGCDAAAGDVLWLPHWQAAQQNEGPGNNRLADPRLFCKRRLPAVVLVHLWNGNPAQ